MNNKIKYNNSITTDELSSFKILKGSNESKFIRYIMYFIVFLLFLLFLYTVFNNIFENYENKDNIYTNYNLLFLLEQAYLKNNNYELYSTLSPELKIIELKKYILYSLQ